MTRKQKDELLLLEKQFQNPLGNVNTRVIEHGTNVDEIILALQTKLENNSDDWNIRHDALLEAMEYLKGGIAESPECDFSKLASGISNCVGDLRSALVKRGSLLIAACAEIFGKEYISSTDIIVPSLFKQLSHGTAVISNSAHLALRSIVKCVQNRRITRLFLSKQQTKSNIQRQVIAESIKIMREEWPAQVIDGIDSELMASLKIYIEDASPEVRQIAKQAMNINPAPLKKSLIKSPRPALAPNAALPEKKISRKSATPQFSARVKPRIANPKETPSNPEESQNPTNNKNNNNIRNGNVNKDNFESIENENNIINLKNNNSDDNNDSNDNISNTNNKSVINNDDNNSFNIINDKQRKFSMSNRITIKTAKKVLFGPPKAKEINLEEISEFMPPRTKSEAKSFLTILDDIISQQKFDYLFGLEELLAPSIISATNVLPLSETYSKILPELFAKYTEEFSVQVHDLLIAFNFDPIILAEAINVYGEQQIADSFVGKRCSEENESVRFFIILFTKKYEIKITPKIRQYLLKLIQKFRTSNDIHVIEEAIKIPETDSNLNKIVDQLILKIKSQKKWMTVYQQLVVQLSSSTLQQEYLDMIEDSLITQFTDILKQGTQAQCHEIRSFLATGAMNCKGISFSKLAIPMLPMLLNENRVEREKTEECFQVLMNDTKTVGLLIDILQNDDNEEKVHAILSIILNYVTRSSLRPISSILPLVVDIVASLIKSEVVGIRRLSIMILVEFKCKVPKEFMPYFKKFAIAHQKLINLYSKKRGQ